MSTFCKHSYHGKSQPRWVGGQKSQNLVNVVCEQPLAIMRSLMGHLYYGYEPHYHDGCSTYLTWGSVLSSTNCKFLKTAWG